MTKEPRFLRLKDGTLIDTNNGKRAVSTEINKAFSDQPQTSSLGKKPAPITDVKRRFLDDLGVSPNQSRAIAAVAAYTIFGLAAIDIAHVLGTEVENVEAIQQSEAYNSMMNGMLQNIREHDQDKVRKKINAAAENAAQKITDLVHSGDPKVALSASKDVLDRAANGGNADLSRRDSSSFTIRIVDERDNPADKIEVEIDA